MSPEKMERWKRVKELAEQGYSLGEVSRTVGLHHASVIYIAQRMGFQFKVDRRVVRHPAETVGRVERMMRLASK